MKTGSITHTQLLMAQAFGSLTDTIINGPTMRVSTRSVMVASYIPDAVEAIQVFGGLTVGDGLQMEFIRSGAATVTQTADGSYWKPALTMQPSIFNYTGGQTVADYTDAMLLAEEDAVNNNIRTLYFPYGQFGASYLISGPKIVIRSGLTVIGDHPSMSQIIFTDLDGGFFWDATNFAGGGIEKLGFVGSFSGGNGDYMIRIGGNNATGTPQRFIARDVLVTCSSGTVSYGIIVDGTAFAGDSGGMRAPFFDNITIFNSTAIAFDNRYVRSGMYNNINIFQAGGNNEILNFTGLANTGGGLTRTTVGISLSNIRCNDLIFDRAVDIAGAPVAVGVNVSASANTSALNLYGAIVSYSNLGGVSNTVFNQTTGLFTNVNF